MTVKKKAPKTQYANTSNIYDIINKGGKPTEHKKESSRISKVTLHLPIALLTQVDDTRKSKDGFVSRNQWIVETISEKIRALNEL